MECNSCPHINDKDSTVTLKNTKSVQLTATQRASFTLTMQDMHTDRNNNCNYNQETEKPIIHRKNDKSGVAEHSRKPEHFFRVLQLLPQSQIHNERLEQDY